MLLLHAVSQQSKPGWWGGGRKQEGVDGQARPARTPSGVYVKVSLRQYHATPFSLLRCQPWPSVTLGHSGLGVSSVASGIKAPPPYNDSTRQLSEVRGRKIRMWNGCLKCAQEDTKGRARTRTHRFGDSRGGIKVGGGGCVWGGVTRSGHEEAAVVFPFRPASPPLLYCFSTTLLTPHIHSRPTEPAELWESTATSGIYGNLKILTSAIVPYTQYSANRVRPIHTDLLFPPHTWPVPYTY